jgi:hypothetical protein
MPSAFRRFPLSLAILAFGFVVFAVATGFTGSQSAAHPEGAYGLLAVDGTVYRFTPSTCAISERDFVTAGAGEFAGEPFWFTSSPDRLSLSFGSATPGDRPSEDDLWLTNVDTVDWTLPSADRVEASTEVRDQRNTSSTAVTASVTVACPPA